MKAVAEKLIPGIPIATRISILQQTSTNDDSRALPDAIIDQVSELGVSTGNQLSVLEELIERATSRNEIQQEIDGISCAPQKSPPH